MESKEIEGTAENWENGLLGRNEEFVCVSSTTVQEVNSALDLHPISIRLQKDVVSALKKIAKESGIGYQPLIRQIVTKFVNQSCAKSQSSWTSSDVPEVIQKMQKSTQQEI